MSEAAEKSSEVKPKKSRKGLVVGLVAALVLAAGGGGAWWFMGRGDADEAALAEKEEARRAASRVFVTLEPFVVNLADRDSERYAQIGIVLEVEGKDANQRVSEKMPAVRNAILLLISSKQAQDLASREGKERLAAEVALAAARTIGWKPPAAAQEPTADEAAGNPKVKTRDGDKAASAKDKSAKEKSAKATKVERPAPNPIAFVHFASFIVQ
jgi:flagellar FliL protein